MKKLYSAIAGFVLTASIASAQCPTYYPMVAGDTMKMTNYDKKGKETGMSQTVVVAVEGNHFDLNGKNYDKKGTEMSSIDFSVTCEENALKIDLRNYMAGDAASAWEGMENLSFEVDGDMLSLPGNLSVGQELPGGVLVVNVLASGAQFMKITVDVSNRIVAAMEDVTTPLGTFSCYKITYDVATKMLFNIKAKGAEWISEIGLTKTESYKENGKLTGSSLRTG